MAEKALLGVDLGGTNMRAGILTAGGEVVRKEGVPTRGKKREGGEAILKRLIDLMLKVLDEENLAPEDIVGAGVGIPGPLDPSIGGAHPPNLKELSGFRITSILQTATGMDVVLENDANAAAWGEFVFGAGRGCRTMMLATLGTGVGGGIVLNGELYRGVDCTAGEFGHVVVKDGGRPCACGSNGCVEAYASADSTVRRFVEALEAGRGSCLANLPRGEITCRAIFEAARTGDALAREITRETGRLLGVLAVGMANLFNPERFLFSGGMIEAGETLFAAIRETVEKRAFPIPAKRMKVLPAALGADAGLIGAAACALTAFGTSR